jgi:SAM-dependent methyltransferase
LHEILEHLDGNARVLDLGCREGSFPAGKYTFLTVRVDLNRVTSQTSPFVQADAVHLPFPSRTFDVIILNHSVEHFSHLKPALQEIGRVVKLNGAAYVAVPDATTLTDRIYRKLFRNAGGHVNLFGSAADLENMLAWYLNLRHIATRTLFSSLIFLNRRNTRDPAVRAQMRFGGFPEPILMLLSGGTRLTDRLFRTRSGVYGWAFYLGRLLETVDAQPRMNVCIRCGEAHPSQMLQDAGKVRQHLILPTYRCPTCDAVNFFTRDLSTPKHFTRVGAALDIDSPREDFREEFHN